MRSGLYPAAVWAFEPTTGVVKVTIRQLFGDQVVSVEPEVARQSDIADIVPVANGDVVLVFFEGADDTRLKWQPRVIDDQMTAWYDARYDARYVNVIGDTMTGALTIGSDTSAGANNLTLNPSVMTGNEGGQIGFGGTTGFSGGVYIDRFQDTLRTVIGGTASNYSDSTGLNIGGNLALKFPTWGGGFYMSDSTWIRTFGDKNIWANTGKIGCNGGMTIGDNGNGPTAGYSLRLAGNLEFTAANPTISASSYVIFPGGLYVSAGPALYSEPVIRAHGGISNDTGTGWVAMGSMTMNQNVIRLVSATDANHVIQYYNGTPSGSGEANNGPFIQGYSSVWLHTVLSDSNFFLSTGGSVFINASRAYSNFSSERFKDDIVSLDPEEALAMVRRWRPVRFRWRPETNPLREIDEGFISEEMFKTTPSLVNVTAPDDETPNWANAVNYPGTAPWLAGAVQALFDRIGVLEARLASVGG